MLPADHHPAFEELVLPSAEAKPGRGLRALWQPGLQGFQVGEQRPLQHLGLVPGPRGVLFEFEGLEPAAFPHDSSSPKSLSCGQFRWCLVANSLGFVTALSFVSPGEKDTS